MPQLWQESGYLNYFSHGPTDHQSTGNGSMDYLREIQHGRRKLTVANIIMRISASMVQK